MTAGLFTIILFVPAFFIISIVLGPIWASVTKNRASPNARAVSNRRSPDYISRALLLSAALFAWLVLTHVGLTFSYYAPQVADPTPGRHWLANKASGELRLWALAALTCGAAGATGGLLIALASGRRYGLIIWYTVGALLMIAASHGLVALMADPSGSAHQRGFYSHANAINAGGPGALVGLFLVPLITPFIVGLAASATFSIRRRLTDPAPA